MAKCTRCGRKGFFLKLTNGLCDNCVSTMRMEQEQAALKARAAELQAELGKSQEAAGNVDKFMAVVRKYTSFEELTPTLLREFVEKIVVHECWKDEQGTRHQDIEIYYSFVGKVDLPDD